MEMKAEAKKIQLRLSMYTCMHLFNCSEQTQNSNILQFKVDFQGNPMFSL